MKLDELRQKLRNPEPGRLPVVEIPSKAKKVVKFGTPRRGIDDPDPLAAAFSTTAPAPEGWASTASPPPGEFFGIDPARAEDITTWHVSIEGLPAPVVREKAERGELWGCIGCKRDDGRGRRRGAKL